MSHFSKCLMTALLLVLTLSGCKPGIYYDPVANKKKAEAAARARQASPTAPVIKAPVAGEKINMIVPG